MAWTDSKKTMNRAKDRIRALHGRLNDETGAPVGQDACGRQLATSPVKLEPTSSGASFPPQELAGGSSLRPYLTGVQQDYVKTFAWGSQDSLSMREAVEIQGGHRKGLLRRWNPHPPPSAGARA